MNDANELPRTCDRCKSSELFTTQASSGGGYAPNYLPQLGTKWFATPNFDVVVCAKCGLTQFFTPAENRAKLSTSSKWRKL
jgi:predicted nucleic-acid-binding Zn-ribbon protein